MTVKELKEKLSKYPDHMSVFLDERKTEFKYGQLNSVRSEYITFSEEEGGEPIGEDTVLILNEE